MDILSAAVADHSPVAVFAMFSGGHDSLVATHIAAQHPRFTAAVHINTGIGIEETREFVRETCRRQGWPLIELHPPDRQYEDLVLQYGFPGPDAHRYMYRYLKERAVRRLVAEHKRGPHDRVMLVTGVRAQESVRRMGHVKPVQREGAKVWVAPLIDWSKRDVEDYIGAQGLQPNPVVRKMHMSGECLCGAYARPGEFDEIEFWYPDVAERIRRLEAEAAKRGVHCRWGTPPPERQIPGQQGLIEALPLCWSCDARHFVVDHTRAEAR